jgi:hypothetical protein
MTRLKIREYKTEDYINIEVAPEVIQGRNGQPIEWWAKYHEMSGPCCTVTDLEGKIVFCGGAHHKWKGCGEIWGDFSPLARVYPHTLWMVRFMLDQLRYVYGYVRLQCSVDVQWETAVRFIEKLGFKREGVMEAYGPGGMDHALYALVRKGGA